MLKSGAAAVPKYPYVLAVLAGVLLLFFAGAFALRVAYIFEVGRVGQIVFVRAFLFAVSAAAGAFFGLAWPGKSWRWGVWLTVLPFIWSCFFRPFAMLSMFCTVVLPACLGSLAAARLRLRCSGASLVGQPPQTFMPHDSQTARANFLRR